MVWRRLSAAVLGCSVIVEIGSSGTEPDCSLLPLPSDNGGGSGTAPGDSPTLS